MSALFPHPISLPGKKGKNIFRHHIRHHHKVELEFISYNSTNYSTNSDSASPPHNLPRTSRQVLKSTENRIFFKRIRFFYVHISPYTSTPFHGKSAQISAQLLTHQFSWAQIQFRIAEITYATDDYGGLTRRPQTLLSTPPHPLTVNVRS